MFSGGIETFISGYTLRDGTKVDAQVVQKAMTFLELGDKSLVPIEIFNGDVEGGVLTDVFSARAVTTGFQLAGYIEDGVVKEGYLVADPTYVSSSTRAFGYLVLLKERPEMDDQKVLPAYTENMDAGSRENAENGVWYGGGNTEPSEGAGGTYIPEQSELDGNNSIEISINEKQLMEYEGNLVMPDYDRGTYRISGLEGNSEVDINYMRNIINSSIKNISLTSAGQGGFLTLDQFTELLTTAALIPDETITGQKIKNDSIKNEDIAAGAINSSKIEDGTITYSDLKGNTISTDDLASNLVFIDGDLLDLSEIDHSTSSLMGFVLPNVTSSSPISPSSGEGYLAYDTAGDQVIYYNGSVWTTVGSSISLYETLSASSMTSSVSGIELINSDELSLIRGCANGQVLKWNSLTYVWYCADDSGASGSGISTVEENNSSIVTSAARIDFLGSDFSITDAGGGEADVAIDYSNSGITRSNQTQSVSGAWTFSNLTISDTNIPLSGSSMTLDFNHGSDRTLRIANSGVGVANLSVDGTISASNFSGSSSGTNTGDQTITLTGDVTGSGTGSFATTISGDAVALTADTTGNYVASVTNGSGISGGNGGSEGAALTLSLGALTADWNQTGAFDIILNNADSQIQILESAGDTFYGTLDVGNLSEAAIYTFTGTTGNVITSSNASTQLSTWDQTASDDLTTSNYATTLDLAYVELDDTPNAAGDISGDFTNGLTIDA
ncbi:MAG: hypothetical protein UT06_C0053G0005, partial [Candidatus Woesebacteria bacterium GW2011_GWA1_38_8]